MPVGGYRESGRPRTQTVFEQHVQQLWDQGAISGEMHMSLGEEGVVAGIIAHMREPDAMALDHRGTAPLIMRGEDPSLLLKEFLGRRSRR